MHDAKHHQGHEHTHDATLTPMVAPTGVANLRAQPIDVVRAAAIIQAAVNSVLLESGQFEK